MRWLANRLLLVLVVFAMTGGLSMTLAQPAEAAMPAEMGGMPCQAGPDTGPHTPAPPCQHLTPDCMKQLGCIVAAALPVRWAGLEAAPIAFAVDYWSMRPRLCGLSRAPEPLPPRTT